MKLSQLLLAGIITSCVCLSTSAYAGGKECKAQATAVAAADKTASDCSDCTVEATAVADKTASECSAHPAAAVAVADKAAGECSAHPATAVAAANKTECQAPAAAVAVAAADMEECADCGGQAVAMNVGDTKDECTSCGVMAALTSINPECPSLGGEVDAQVSSMYKGFTIGYCCGGCEEGFEASSETMKDAFVMQNATVLNTECPMSGEAVSAGTVSLYNGYAVGFCCEDCQSKFDAASDSEKVATIAKFAKTINTECPMSGESVADGTVIAYRGNLMGVCCEDCLAHFNESDNKDKTKMLLKAANITMNEETGALECQSCEGGGEAAAL